MAPDQNINKDSQGVSDAIQTNLEKIAQFEKRQHSKRSRTQRAIERVSLFFGSTSFLIGFVILSLAWIAADSIWHVVGHPYFDAPPFPILQGIVTFTGVLITMAVLIRQNRLAQVEEARAHLELQVNLLAEQKATKIIMLLEELRRDLPGVNNRQDLQAATMQAMTNPDAVLKEIETRRTDLLQPDVEPE